MMDFNDGGDVGRKIVNAAMDAALDLLVGEEGKPALNLLSQEALVGVKWR